MPADYGTVGAKRLPWSWATERLGPATVYWLATLRPDGAPHVRPVDGTWVDNALFVGGSPEAGWIRNLANDGRVTVHLPDAQGVVILEGEARQVVPDEALAERLAVAARKYESMYGPSSAVVLRRQAGLGDPARTGTGMGAIPDRRDALGVRVGCNVRLLRRAGDRQRARATRRALRSVPTRAAGRGDGQRAPMEPARRPGSVPRPCPLLPAKRPSASRAWLAALDRPPFWRSRAAGRGSRSSHPGLTLATASALFCHDATSDHRRRVRATRRAVSTVDGRNGARVIRAGLSIP